MQPRRALTPNSGDADIRAGARPGAVHTGDQKQRPPGRTGTGGKRRFLSKKAERVPKGAESGGVGRSVTPH